MTYSQSDNAVFCDYLTVTNRPDNSCVQDVKNYLLAKGAYIDSDYNGRVSAYLEPLQDMNSRVQFKETNNFVSISATGSALRYLRQRDFYNDYLNILASVPHNVTRLDAAYDVMEDTPKLIKRLARLYPEGMGRITRKAVPITRFLAVRGDGQETGTVYFGRRGKSSIIARMYDKQWEQLSKYGRVTAPITRYELECGRLFDSSLKDAADPYLLFWNHASVFNLKIPKPLDPWVPAGEFSRYEKLARSTPMPLEVVTRKIQRSMELRTLHELGRSMGSNGSKSILREISKLFEQLDRESDTAS